MRGVIADTGPLYAAYDKSDRLHARAVQQLAILNQAGIAVIVPYPVLLEAHSLILKRLGIPAAYRLIEEITQGADLINLTISDYQQAEQLLKRFPDQAITLFDASTSVLSNRLHLPVWTYDHHFDIMKTAVWRD
ncbi:MAG: type II toxin-antitoxin system VapC family toxin [Alkalinema sp. RU_4_3]|nr:type II toxin-antitoxin system VapC family toxin [Alkalinema sp. RU_4_3]